MKYLISIADRSVEVEIRDGVVIVDGREVGADLLPGGEPGVWRLALGTETRSLALTRTSRGGWEIITQGERFTANAVDERTARARSVSGPSGRATGGELVTAPMPGLVLRVAVEVGATVEASSGVVVLEAMKMENEIRCGMAGVVRRVFVEPGAAVEKGAPLVELGAAS